MESILFRYRRKSWTSTSYNILWRLPRAAALRLRQRNFFSAAVKHADETTGKRIGLCIILARCKRGPADRSRKTALYPCKIHAGAAANHRRRIGCLLRTDQRNDSAGRYFIGWLFPAAAVAEMVSCTVSANSVFTL